jgi:nitroreductase
MDYDGLLELVKNRRSIRRYRPDPIPAKYIEMIIEVAHWAPSGFNFQPWEFVVVKNSAYKDAIARYIFDDLAKTLPKKDVGDLLSGPLNFSTAPVFIILYGDIRSKIGLPRAAQDNDFEKIFNSSLASAFLYMHLAAASLGLASQWVSQISFPSVDTMVKKLLEIPAELRAYDMMAVGYTAVRPRPKLIRPIESMIHQDYCGIDSFRSDAEVEDYARRTKTWTTATHHRQADEELLQGKIPE